MHLVRVHTPTFVGQWSMQTKPPAVVAAPPPPAVLPLAEKDYDAQVLNAAEPVVLDFFSADSKPCTELAPRFGAVAEKFVGKIKFFRVARAENDALAKKLNVTVSPTLLFFKAGKELGDRLSGDDIKRTAIKASVEALLK